MHTKAGASNSDSDAPCRAPFLFTCFRGSESVKDRALLLVAMASLVGPIAFVSPAAGQQYDPWRDFNEWESRNRALNGDHGRPEVPSRSRRSLAASESFRDRKRIRALNLDLKRAVSPGGALDLNFLARSAAEINRRAKRLKSNLALPKPEQRTQKRSEAKLDELRASIPILESAITDFVENPTLKNGRVLDAKLRTRAAGDLNEVIELSDWWKKSSKKLAKSTAMH